MDSEGLTEAEEEEVAVVLTAGFGGFDVEVTDGRRRARELDSTVKRRWRGLGLEG